MRLWRQQMSLAEPRADAQCQSEDAQNRMESNRGEQQIPKLQSTGARTRMNEKDRVSVLWST
jgi:hypothetical protein